MNRGPRVVVGIPLYNHAETVREALGSLLSQRFTGYRVIAIDDVSTDGTAEVVSEFLPRDGRLSLLRNDVRLGMIGNWRRCFLAATERWPDACYFAWGSDHDVWDPDWMGRLVAELDSHPEAVLAYPFHRQIDGIGPTQGDPRARFDTAGVSRPIERMRRAILGMSPGNIVYGLYRVGPLRRAGVFRTYLLPDRLLLTELSLQGEFRQVSEVLWCRRRHEIFSLARQRRGLFGPTRPWWAWLPWWWMHSWSLAYQLGVRGAGRPVVGRLLGLRASGEAVVLSAGLHLARGLRRSLRRGEAR